MYAFAILAVFLCLAALYESWSIPLAVILVVPVGVLCFALAMVWLIRPLALVVLGALAWMGVELAAALTERRESMFGDAPYLRYEVLSGDDWALLALCGACAGVLAWLAIQTWRGGIVPALTQDWADAGDD